LLNRAIILQVHASGKAVLIQELTSYAARLIFKGPPSEIIRDLAGPHSDAERRARIHLILKQRATIIEDAGYEQMLAQIEILQQVMDWGRWQGEQDAAQDLKAEQDRRRREGIDQRTALEREVLGRVVPAPHPLGIRVVPMKGRRLAPGNPLTTDNLYLDDARPLWINRPGIGQT
jgi:hypothetical protein